MPDRSKLAGELGERFLEYARAQARSTRFVKLVLVTGGALVVAVAQGVEIANALGHISVWTIGGFTGAGFVFVGGIYELLREHDASQALDVSRRALEDVRQLEKQTEDEAYRLERQKEEFRVERAWLDNEINRGLQLYNSMDVMRGAIEQSLALRETSAAKIIQTGLDAACNSLLLAFNFQIKDTWTICIYHAQGVRESDKVILRCVAHARKIPCKIKAARAWPEGVGVAGVSYSMNNEIIIPDLAAAELGTVFNIRASARHYDAVRYRSMVSVPISVGDSMVPWGVAVVSSDQPHHFDIEQTDGVPTAEPIRAIAAMAALAVKAVQIVEPLPTPERPSSDAAEGSQSPEGLRDAT